MSEKEIDSSDLNSDSKIDFNGAENLKKLINKFDILIVSKDDKKEENTEGIIDTNLLLPLSKLIKIKQNKEQKSKKIIYPKKRKTVSESEDRKKIVFKKEKKG